MASRILPSDFPYEQYVVRGPYVSRTKKHRRVVVLESKTDGSLKSTSYARYLLSVKEGRLLLPTEEVDHVDGDPMNDAIENLQILSPDENRNKSKRSKTVINLLCDECGTPIFREKSQSPTTKSYKHAFCSRRCNGVFGAKSRKTII